MATPLVDPFQRRISYLRLSVTDRCDFRCLYCMAESVTFLPKAEVLTIEELDRLASAFIRRGVDKLRITGGEPLVRRGIMDLFRALSRHLETGALRELTLTTNGSQLARFADDLAGVGVRRINVSLDTLVAEKFAHISRRGQLHQVMAGIDAAQAAGLKIKINTVALKGFNEDEIFSLTEFAADRGFDLTFIEVMPMGDVGNENRLDQYLPLTEVRERLAARYTIRDLSERTGGPARYVQLHETEQKIGFITPLTHNFCESCNRVRVTCTGEIYTCLGQEGKADLRAPLRASTDSDAQLDRAIDAAVLSKPRGHDFDFSRGAVEGQMPRTMSHTGG